MLRRMRVLLAAVAALCAGAVALAQESPPGKIDPNADQLLRSMSDYVAGMNGFKVQVDTVDEAVTKDGQRIQFLAQQSVSVRRPDKFRVERLGPVADTVFRYDGKQFSLYGKRTGYYATAPAPGTLEEAIDTARSKYGMDAPSADLFLGRPYDELMAGVTQASYLGVEPIGTLSCHHLAFKGADVDFQVWVQDGAKPLPCRYTIVSKSDEGQPEFSASLSNWQPNVELSPALFAFTPPPGSKRIELKSQQDGSQP